MNTVPATYLKKPQIRIMTKLAEKDYVSASELNTTPKVLREFHSKGYVHLRVKKPLMRKGATVELWAISPAGRDFLRKSIAHAMLRGNR